eukprot:scaffold168712_cov31-Tisochrysis_lutea.AAC.6
MVGTTTTRRRRRWCCCCCWWCWWCWRGEGEREGAAAPGLSLQRGGAKKTGGRAAGRNVRSSGNGGGEVGRRGGGCSAAWREARWGDRKGRKRAGRRREEGDGSGRSELERKQGRDENGVIGCDNSAERIFKPQYLPSLPGRRTVAVSECRMSE